MWRWKIMATAPKIKTVKHEDNLLNRDSRYVESKPGYLSFNMVNDNGDGTSEVKEYKVKINTADANFDNGRMHTRTGINSAVTKELMKYRNQGVKKVDILLEGSNGEVLKMKGLRTDRPVPSSKLMEQNEFLAKQSSIQLPELSEVTPGNQFDVNARIKEVDPATGNVVNQPIEAELELDSKYAQQIFMDDLGPQTFYNVNAVSVTPAKSWYESLPTGVKSVMKTTGKICKNLIAFGIGAVAVAGLTVEHIFLLLWLLLRV